MQQEHTTGARRLKFIITGGAGFIGCNTASYLLQHGHEVVIIDNLSRRGSDKNLNWLRSQPGNLIFIKLDVRDYKDLRRALADHHDADVLLHLAAQVAVTTSVLNPRQDFEINALGTLNLLEAVREVRSDPVILYVSTNKVYGEMTHVPVTSNQQRYFYQDLPRGAAESTPLDFHSPYGCSKGAADQYVRDYHRIYGLRTIVFRNSCIYGLRQFGVEDQGWVAWFCIAAALNRAITIYGDGKQIRDVLYIDDLIAAFMQAVAHIDTTQGQVYNIGGGADNTLAIWTEFGPILEKLAGRPIPVEYADWRPGDQKVYVSDIARASYDFGWQPATPVEEGIRRLYAWVLENRHLFED